MAEHDPFIDREAELQAEVVRGSSNIAGAVNQVASSAQNYREESRRALEAATSLSELTIRLHELASRFKLT